MRLLLTSTVILTLALNACGSGTATTSAPSSPPAVTSSGSTPSASVELRKVSWGYAQLTGTFMPAIVGREAGIFEKHGIDLQVVFTRDGQSAVNAMIAGQLPFITLADPSVTTAALQGADSEWVAVNVHAPHLVMYSQPSIATPKDLQGKKIGVTTLGSLTALMAEQVVKQAGLDPKKDVQLLAVGGGPAALAAIASGQIDAIVTAPENPAPGKKVLVDLGAGGYDFPQAGLATTKSEAKSDPRLVQDMVQSFVESTQRFKTDRVLAEQVLARVMGETLKSDADVRANYEGTSGALSTDVVPKAKELQSVLDMIAPATPQAAGAKPETFFDDTFAKALTPG